MEKKFKFQADPQDKGNFKYLMVGIPLALVGLFLILIPKLNLAVNNPNVAGYTDPKYAWLFFGIGLFLIFVYVFIKFLVSWLAKLEITGANLIIKNPAKPLNQISIADISSVALRYEVASIRISGPNLVPFASLIKSYRYYVRQWGDLVQTKNGEIYEIKQNIQNLEDFIKELQNINHAITQSHELEEQSKQQAEEDFKKTRSFALNQRIIYEKDL